MKESINNFRFKFAGYGHYTVYYTSPTTGRLTAAEKSCKAENHLKVTK